MASNNRENTYVSKNAAYTSYNAQTNTARPVVVMPPRGASGQQPQQRIPQQRIPQNAPQNAQRANSGAKQRTGKNPYDNMTEKEYKKLLKQKRKERDYFYVMRKFPTFLIFLYSLIIFFVSAVGLSNAFIELPSGTEVLTQFTSVYIVPDVTPEDERVAYTGEDEAGNPVEVDYEDQTMYITFADLVFGAVNGIAPSVGLFKDEEGNSKALYYNSVITALDTATEEGIEDSMLPISSMLFKYAPLLFIITLITSLITMITSLLGLFGKRIFKGFGLAGIIMLVTSVAFVLMGVVGMGVQTGNPSISEEDESVVSVLDVSSLPDFAMGFLEKAPETADAAFENPPTEFYAGYGLLILTGASAIMIICSFFARRKIPYSIFDR